MSYRTILVGTDGSPTATVAVGAAVRLAKRCRAKLVVVGALGGFGVEEKPLRVALQDALALATKSKVDVVATVAEGTPAEALVSSATEREADLIVLGNRGMGAATRIRLGSIPDAVAHDAPCDLLIVDTTDAVAQERQAAPPFHRILAGTDGSATASEAVHRAFEVAALYAAPVTLVFVGDPLIGAIRLEEASSARPDEVEVEPVVEQGEPAARITGLARDAAVDLVVVGNKGMSGLKRILGSVPNHVAHESPTNVLIVRTVDRSIDDIRPGSGALVDVGGRRLAVYRTEDGSILSLNPRCTHLGCTVDWNAAGSTWDCPCHGSRFNADGSVLKGPAERALELVPDQV